MVIICLFSIHDTKLSNHATKFIIVSKIDLSNEIRQQWMNQSINQSNTLRIGAIFRNRIEQFNWQHSKTKQNIQKSCLPHTSNDTNWHLNISYELEHWMQTLWWVTQNRDKLLIHEFQSHRLLIVSQPGIARNKSRVSFEWTIWIETVPH